jgi:hypothetical protein
MPAERGFSVSSSIPFGLGGAIGVGRGLDAGNCGDVLAVGGEDDGVEAGDGDGVAGMDDAARLALDGFEVGGVVGAGDVGVFAVEAVIEEFADRNGDELGNAADMVVMEVGDEHVIDAGDAGVMHGAWMRVASRLSGVGQPVSTSRDAPEGETSSVAWPPSTSMA